MKKVIFRRIGGRLIPISVDAVKKVTEKGAKEVEIALKHGLQEVGKFTASQSPTRKHRFFISSRLTKDFRNQGLGKEFYNRLARQVKSMGGKFIVGTTENDNVIKAVRNSIGNTKGIKQKLFPSTTTTFVTKVRKR